MKTASVALQSMTKNTAVLMPGIGIDYSKAAEKLSEDSLFRSNCLKAGIDNYKEFSPAFSKNTDCFFQDTLYNQILSYVVNCTISDLYDRRNLSPQVGAGYSLGIYASLYAAGYYSFETGLSILRKAYSSVKEICLSHPQNFGMGVILGFKENEIQKLLFADLNNKVHIAVYNGKRSFVIAGIKEAIDYSLDKALKLGAFSARPILTVNPYHTIFLEGLSNSFLKFMKTFTFNAPKYSVLSLVDGEKITPANLADCVVRSLYSPLRLDLAINILYREYGIKEIYEIGPINSIKKLVHYVNKKMTVHLFNEDMAN